MARLRTTTGHTLDLPARRVGVGTSPANDITVQPGHGLAPLHFYLQPGESGYVLEDGGSGLGTLVNGKLVSWVPLKPGDVITAGNLTMQYESPGGPGGTPPVEEPAAPPSWLPPEALLPTVPPWARQETGGGPPASTPAPARPGKGSARLRAGLAVLAALAGLFYYYTR